MGARGLGVDLLTWTPNTMTEKEQENCLYGGAAGELPRNNTSPPRVVLSRSVLRSPAT